MRAVVLTSMAAVFLLGFQARPCHAQSPSPDKPAAAQPLTGPGGKEPSPSRAAGAPNEASKKETTTKTEPPARVGTLSPEEKRRAARARERAAAKAAPTRAAETKQEDKEAKTSPPSASEAQRPTTRATANTQQGQTRALAARLPTRGLRAKRTERRRTASTTNRRFGRMNGPQRSRFAGPGSVPQVGDVIPSGVPLFPMRPGYRVGAGYGPDYGPRAPWRFLPRPAYPAFPRVPPYPRFGGGDADDDE